MPGNIGPLEIAVVLIIVLIIFGPKRLPELGRSMGRGIREFRNSIGGGGDKDDSNQDRAELKAADPGEPASQTGAPSAATSEPVGSERKPADSVEGEVVTDKRA